MLSILICFASVLNRMKKVLSYILISFVILANILAPFGAQLDNKNIRIGKNTANAEYQYDLEIKPTLSSNTISLEIKVLEGSLTGDSNTEGGITKNIDLGIRATLLREEKKIDNENKDLDRSQKNLIIEFKKLDPATAYTTKIELFEYISTTSALGSPGYAGNSTKILLEKNILTPTLKEGQGTITQENINISGESNSADVEIKPSNSKLPSCNILNGYLGGEGTVLGCIAQAFYYVLFVPSSYVFALAGTFFDYIFSYTIQDSTYRSAFVVEGWGLVRDFCNIFFIFVLLYIAIGTILGLHGVNYKSMIINVVIIGLFINFSLFITQVFIDASNITARIFYNSDAIKVTKKGQTDNTIKNADDGSILYKENEAGVISLSGALVNKVNPQNLILQSERIDNIGDPGGQTNFNDVEQANGFGAGSFILITLLATAVNIVGFIIFLSVSLIFVARVVGLWIAMIFAPLAFFTYTVPSFKKWDTVGFDKWLPETLSMAFLAPVFVFLLYIILKFLELDLIPKDTGNGLAFVISIILPFAIIMVLLMKAKDIAKKMSGSMGQQITGAIAAAGGLALGGAALGGAALGRKFIGGTINKASNTKWNKTKMSFDKEYEKWEKGGKKGTAPDWKTYAAANGVSEKAGLFSALGNKFNKNKKDINEVDHARHVTDEAIEKAGFKGRTWNQLDVIEKDKVLANVKKENYTKHTEDIEREYRTKNNLEKGNPLTAVEEQNIKNRIEQEILNSRTPAQTAMYGNKLNNQEIVELQKRSRDEINSENAKRNKLPDLSSDDRKNIKDEAMKKAEEDFEKEIEHASQKVAGFARAFSKANSGTYDLRNLSQIKSDKREGWGTKVSTFLTSDIIAGGIRAGLKNGAGIDHGKGQGNFTKDLMTSLTEALKSINVKVEMPKSSGGGGHDDHGGGHGGGHH